MIPPQPTGLTALLAGGSPRVRKPGFPLPLARALCVFLFGRGRGGLPAGPSGGRRWSGACNRHRLVGRRRQPPRSGGPPPESPRRGSEGSAPSRPRRRLHLRGDGSKARAGSCPWPARAAFSLGAVRPLRPAARAAAMPRRGGHQPATKPARSGPGGWRTEKGSDVAFRRRVVCRAPRSGSSGRHRALAAGPARQDRLGAAVPSHGASVPAAVPTPRRRRGPMRSRARAASGPRSW
jgi:hypothetical protein